EDALFYTPGNFTNNGFTQNQGDMVVAGHWRNSNVYQGIGALTLSGEKTQIIINNNQAINKLIIEGGGQKFLVGNLKVTDELHLENGLFTTSMTDSLWLSSKVKISGGSQFSYINGPLGQLGSGPKFYPIGTDEYYTPIEFSEILGANPAVVIIADFDSGFQPQTEGDYVAVSPVSYKINLASGFVENYEMILPPKESYFEYDQVAAIWSESGNDMYKTVSSSSDRFLLPGIANKVGLIAIETPVNNGGQKFYFSKSLSPNAFDEENKSVRVYGNELLEEDFSLTVFNRWGIIVYETNSLEEMQDSGWNGKQKQNGELVQSGSYPFILRATKFTGEKIEEKGIISVFR
ncbi:hypothetical protein E1176_00970, partial [Fulvivirga sp. RKSG066]|uniref:T9SS type B sorting domain-containing protein n=1 Tax=Fulvivirga aurantia TaxID=2529383 RepID=UPI0012BCE31B